MTARIVVGVDGSPGSIAALHWAHDEARRREAELEVVRCCHESHVAPGSGLDSGTRSLEQLLSAHGLRQDESAVPDLLETTAEGHPGPTLCAVARDADLLVVGSRGHGAFPGMLLGSVSHHCVSHAPCPVVVVRGES